jgi:glycosyltransferase involved in cell wall biosynthesis
VIDTLGIGGAEQVCITLANLLFDKEVFVNVLVLNGKGSLFFQLNKHIECHNLQKKSNYSIASLFNCAKILRQYNIAHVHMRHNYNYVRLVQLLFRIDIKIILHDHYGSIDKDISVPKFIQYFKPDFYIGVSNSLTDWAKNNLKLNNNIVFSLPNCVIKQDLGKGQEKRHGLVCVGNIKPIKNQLFAIQLAHKLNKELTIYGIIQDKAYFKVLKDDITRLNIEHQIHFVHDCSNIQKELFKYDCAIHVAKSESGPLVLAEYLAQSIPFLSYHTGEIAHNIAEALPELIMSNFNMDEWEMRINKMKDKAYNFDNIFDNYFSSKLYMKRCLNIYDTIISKN